MNTLNRRSTDSFYVKPQVNERPLRRATDSFVDGVVTKNGYSINRPIVSDSLSKTIPIRKEILPSQLHNGLQQTDPVSHHLNSSAEVTPLAPSEDGKLSGREVEILNWVKAGKTNSEVAHILCISSYTVKNHLQHIYKKLDVYNRLQAVMKAR
jgi:ATP/maltotriose-dependent transcriptional regulator MalT